MLPALGSRGRQVCEFEASMNPRTAASSDRCLRKQGELTSAHAGQVTLCREAGRRLSLRPALYAKARASVAWRQVGWLEKDWRSQPRDLGEAKAVPVSAG